MTVSLMFVCVLLAVGHARARARGARLRAARARAGLAPGRCWPRRSRWPRCARSPSTLLMLVRRSALFVAAGLGPLRRCGWSRWPAARSAFGALGVAIGALAREVRAASLLAFLLSLPIAFLALVPRGAVAAGLYDVIRVVSALFPFSPRWRRSTRRSTTPARPGAALAHLAVARRRLLALARVALRALRVMPAPIAHAPARTAPTAIRPTARRGRRRAQLAAARAPTARTPARGSPARDESFYTDAGPAPGARPRRARRGRRAARYAFAVLDTDARRPRSSAASRWPTSCAARGRTRRSATGSTRTRAAAGHATRAVRLMLRFAFEHAGPAPRAAGDHPAQRALGPRRREGRLPPRGPRAALPEDQRRAGRTTTSTR